MRVGGRVLGIYDRDSEISSRKDTSSEKMMVYDDTPVTVQRMRRAREQRAPNVESSFISELLIGYKVLDYQASSHDEITKQTCREQRHVRTWCNKRREQAVDWMVCICDSLDILCMHVE